MRSGCHPSRKIGFSILCYHFAVDLLTPMFAKTDYQDTLLAVVCVFMWFYILRVLAEKNLAAVARAIWEIMGFFVVPRFVKNENDAEFTDYLISCIARLNGLDDHTNYACKSRANDAAVRTNRTI